MREGALPVRPGEVIGGKYRVESTLGQGGMAVVVAARHVDLDELVAVKILLKQRAESPEVRERFAREARAAVRIKSEHVARVIDVGALDDGTPYIVMEHLEGEDLAALLSRRERVPPTEAVLYILQICDALREAHQLGIIHRDVKPANLFLAKSPGRPPRLKVLDFGISKVERHDRRRTETKEILGSPWYMAPEQMQSAKSADARSDIWSLGVILYELVTGKVPFDGDTMTEVIVKVLHDATPLRESSPDLPAALEPIIKRCLAKNPEDRYASIDEFSQALRALERPSRVPDVRNSGDIRIKTPPLARLEDIELIESESKIELNEEDGMVVDEAELLPTPMAPPVSAKAAVTPVPPARSVPPRPAPSPAPPGATPRPSNAPVRISNTPAPPSATPAPVVVASRPPSRPPPPPVPKSKSAPPPPVAIAATPSAMPTVGTTARSAQPADSSAAAVASTRTPTPAPAAIALSPAPAPADVRPDPSPSPQPVEVPAVAAVDPRTVPTERPPRSRPQAVRSDRWPLVMAAAILPIGVLFAIVFSGRDKSKAREIESAPTSAAAALAPGATAQEPTPGSSPVTVLEPAPVMTVVPGPDPPPRARVSSASEGNAAAVPRAASTSTTTTTTAAQPSHAGGQDDDGALVGFQVARRNHASVKDCWASSSKSTNVVTVAASVDANGSVTSANARATNPGLSQCVEGKVRGWTFPAGATARSYNIPIRLGRN